MFPFPLSFSFKHRFEINWCQKSTAKLKFEILTKCHVCMYSLNSKDLKITKIRLRDLGEWQNFQSYGRCSWTEILNEGTSRTEGYEYHSWKLNALLLNFIAILIIFTMFTRSGNFYYVYSNTNQRGCKKLIWCEGYRGYTLKYTHYWQVMINEHSI